MQNNCKLYYFVLLENGPDDHALGQRGGQVLERVHDQVDLVLLQAVLQLLGEEALLPDLVEGHVQPLVAHGGAGHDGEVGRGEAGGQQGLHVLGLGHGQLEVKGQSVGLSREFTRKMMKVRTDKVHMHM